MSPAAGTHLPAPSPDPGPGAAVPDGDLPQLASDLLDELEEQRRLILASGTFGPVRRTYDSLAAEPGVGRERVRQLETRRCCIWLARPRTPGTARRAGAPLASRPVTLRPPRFATNRR